MSSIKSNHPGLIILFRVIFAILTLAVMVYIFILSAENAQQSSQTSAGLIEKVVDTFVPSYKEMPKLEQEKLVFSLQDVVRKAAHFAIYAALGFFAACFTATFNGSFFVKLLCCQLFSTAYAVSDEYHQKFSAGRSFQLSDIGYDSAGAFLGIVVVLLFALIVAKHRRRAGEKVRKRDLLNQLKAFEEKLMEADNYIKQLTDVIADKDNKIKQLEEKLNAATSVKEEIITENAEISAEINAEEISEEVAEAVTEPVASEYHDFEFAKAPNPEQADDLNTYAVKAISKIVTESVKIGCVLASSDNDNKKELLNLALGRTEVAKNEISMLVTAPLEPDLIKASIDKECALVMEYYQSILAQL